MSYIRSNRGEAMINAIVIIMVIVIVVGGITEFMRMKVIAQGVRDSTKSSILSVASQNSVEIFGGSREGYSGAYEQAGDTWKDIISEGNVYAELDSLLGLVDDGSRHIRYEQGVATFWLSDLDVQIVNSPFAANSSDSRFQVLAKIKLTIPMKFSGTVLPPMSSFLSIKASFMSKF